MSTISLCMIVRNEKDVLARCLESVKEVVDEILLIQVRQTGQKRLLHFTQIRYMILYGLIILQQRGIILFSERRWTIVCGWMRGAGCSESGMLLANLRAVGLLAE